MFAGAVMLSACGSSGGGSGSGGAGATTGTGGHGSGGTTGTGGHFGSGGAVGSGGVTGSGGSVVGTGGAHATGGAIGSGGNGSGGNGSGGSATGGSGSGGSATGGGGAGGSSSGGAGGGAAGGSAGGGNGGGAAGGMAGGGGTAGAAAGGAAGGAAGQAAGGGGGMAGGSAGGAAGGAGGTDPVVARGEYLAKNVLGCAGCHTPQGGAAFSGTDCFVNSNGSCLSSANLTNDDTGLKSFTKQQIEDAFRLGKYPNDPTKYLFANMPYYQFANVSDADADAIVAYLRTLPGVSHAVQANTAPYNVRPTAPENAAVSPNTLPAASPVAGPTNGKYLATLVCVSCHTVDLTGSMPKIIDASKAFQGGRSVTTTVNGTSKTLQSANLTPDATGLMSWNVTQVANAITTAKDKNGVALCGMRALANMTPSDASDIASYLLAIPPVANPITMTCQ